LAQVFILAAMSYLPYLGLFLNKALHVPMSALGMIYLSTGALSAFTRPVTSKIWDR
jgi:predicted MFS family arabinose efflux permease